MNVHAQLKEWALAYVKSRDAFDKAIIKLESLDGDFVAHKHSGEVVRFLVRPEVDVGELAAAEGRVSAVVLNTRGNVDRVVGAWERLAKKKGLRLFFVNPVANEKWLLYPSTHDRVIERKALKRGLYGLFAAVPECTE